MSLNTRLVRLFRAVSGKTQRQFAKLCGVPSVQMARYELDKAEPSPEEMAAMASQVRLTLEDGERVLRLIETLQQPRWRTGSGIDGLILKAQEDLAMILEDAYRDFLRIHLPGEGDEPAPSPAMRRMSP
jgi:transcriptional regulator with XRE-family HTH domain